jgi:hypothetical protein
VPISTLQLCPSLAILLSLRQRDGRRRPVDERTEFPDVRPSDAIDIRGIALLIATVSIEDGVQRVASGREEFTPATCAAEHRGDRGEHKTADDGAQ